MKLLKKKLLFSLVFDQPGLDFTYHSYKYLYWRTSEYEAGSVRDAVNDLVKEALVDKLTRNRRAWFRVTASGRQVLLKSWHYQIRQEPWDKHWRLLIITNKIGASLRPLQRDLQALGYRHLSRGVYLTGANVSEATRELLIKNHWLNQAVVIESRRVLGADDQQLARNLWHLESLGRQYDQFITLADRLLRLSRRNLVLLQQAKFGFKAVFDGYFKLLLADPGLPKALLPPKWPADEARELFFRLAELAKTAKV
ncbi:MAG: PaaX family transcriptional regulator C-terminal domain-containing protein [Patescibacteria group bacterium]|nr:PaaX family transcriptional regulator C-terminal domain-containing protein [Patescibacteria group bacterium]